MVRFAVAISLLVLYTDAEVAVEDTGDWKCPDNPTYLPVVAKEGDSDGAITWGESYVMEGILSHARAAAANATRQLSCLATFVAHADAVLAQRDDAAWRYDRLPIWSSTAYTPVMILHTEYFSRLPRSAFHSHGLDFHSRVRFANP